MLTQRAPALVRFTRNDATRLFIAAAVLVGALTAILGIDILPQPSLNLVEGDLAPSDIAAPRATTFESEVQTEAAREAARAAVPNQYDFTPDKAIAIAAEQQLAFDDRVDRVDAAFDLELTSEDRQAFLETAVPNLPDTSRAALIALDRVRWAAVRAEATRVLDATLRTELRDDEVAEARTRLDGRMAGDLSEAERDARRRPDPPAARAQLVVQREATATERDVQAAAVEPVMVSIAQNQVIARSGSRWTPPSSRSIGALGLGDDGADVASFAGWFLLSVLLVGMLLAWLWRFRPTLWHRDNVLLLIGLLLVGATLALKVTADRSILPFFLPDGRHRDAPGHPPRRVGRGHRAVDRRHPRRGGRWRSSLSSRLHLPGRPGRHRRRAQGRSTAGLRPGGDRRVRGQRHGRVGLLVARRARPARRAGAVVRLRRSRPPDRPSPRSARSRCSARCSGS